MTIVGERDTFLGITNITEIVTSVSHIRSTQWHLAFTILSIEMLHRIQKAGDYKLRPRFCLLGCDPV
jgi:hypothetical protein